MAAVCRALALLATASAAAGAAAEPNPPVWPASVVVFGPETPQSTIEAAVGAAFARNGGHVPEFNGQWSSERFAFLFKPGRYDVDVPVGYYTQVLGLGQSPADVVFTSGKGVYSDEGSYTTGSGSLNDFWRGAENFRTEANELWLPTAGMLWAASQASPLRRILVDNDLILAKYRKLERVADFASGGYLGNLQVLGSVQSVSQQQYFTRNSVIKDWISGVWNHVFVGTQGAPASHCGHTADMGLPYVTVDAAPVVAEKPFITIDVGGRYVLNIPRVRTNAIGFDWTNHDQVDFSSVYVARADVDTAQSINAKLATGLHVVLAPGIYRLTEALVVATSGQVLLGIGLATLVASNGTPAVKVASAAAGVRVAGLLLEAGTLPTDVLLQWGDHGSTASGAAARNMTSTSPPTSGSSDAATLAAEQSGFMHDVHARVGGPRSADGAQVRVMVEINSGNVIGDNMWLWRADHTESGIVKFGGNAAQVSLAVNGDDVTMYGLACEHALQDLVQWNGERGRTYFFQAELPYDVTQEYANQGYVGYRVGPHVKEHGAWGLGVYHYFRDHPVQLETAIRAPPSLESSFVSPLVVYLNGLGTVQHILNDKGSATSKSLNHTGAVQWLCSGGSGPAPGPAAAPACQVSATVWCPGHMSQCRGEECCPDGSTCPSAPPAFRQCVETRRGPCVPVSSSGNISGGVWAALAAEYV